MKLPVKLARLVAGLIVGVGSLVGFDAVGRPGATVTVDPPIQTAKIRASGKEVGDRFGISVAIDGDTAIVGADFEDTGGGQAGAAYLFERDPQCANNWCETVKIQASDKLPGDFFGFSVGVSGDTAVVGAWAQDTGGIPNAGAAYLFEPDPECENDWCETAKIEASDKQASDFFGVSVAISGDTAIVGAFEDTGGVDAGAAYMFERDSWGANNWGQTAKIQAHDKEAGDRFGFHVAISGDTAIVGADREATGGAAVGAAYFFEPTPGGSNKWGETAKIQASDKQAGDAFGFSVAISGGTAIVGALAKSTGAVRAGAAYLFESPVTIQALIANVGDLVDQGLLDQQQGTVLIDALQRSQVSLDAGRDIAAMNQLLAFTNNVRARVNAGDLTEAQGQALIDVANAIIDQILAG